MRICIITTEERGRLINYQLPPVCTQHHHCSHNQALKRIDSGLFELVTDPQNESKQYITELPMHYLAVKKSGNIGVVQRIKRAQPKHIEKIEFGDDDTSPLKRVKQSGTTVATICARQQEHREQQGSAVKQMTAIVCRRRK